MSSFEDLLGTSAPLYSCKACRMIEALDPKLQEEVDAAMAKPTFSSRRLALGLSAVSEGMDISENTVAMHRTRRHRR